MELTPINGSSNVAAIGYHDGAIFAEYKDGSFYRWERPIETFRALSSAESKGRFLAQLGKGARVDREKTPAAAPPKTAGVAVLDSLTGEADKCCYRAFLKLGLAEKLEAVETFECPTCGQEYRPKLTGAIRHWEAHCWTAKL